MTLECPGRRRSDTREGSAGAAGCVHRLGAARARAAGQFAAEVHRYLTRVCDMLPPTARKQVSSAQVKDPRTAFWTSGIKMTRRSLFMCLHRLGSGHAAWRFLASIARLASATSPGFVNWVRTMKYRETGGGKLGF